jgi:hypothetical protein
VKDRITERHSGVSGWFVSKWDAVTGLPAWATREYDGAEREFADGACELAKTISAEVNGVVLACERMIDDAQSRIQAVFDELAQRMPGWAAQQQALFAGRLGGLRQEARQAQSTFTSRLAERAIQAVNEVREKVAALRDAAKGIIGKIRSFIVEFAKDPVRALVNGLLDLVGIARSAFWSVVKRIARVVGDIARDPLGFARNLLRGIGEGFAGFFQRIGDHLLKGLLGWLLGGLAEAGVEVPKELSFRSVVTFLLQIMGLTWDRVKKRIARTIGEGNLGLIEKAWEIVSGFVKEGVHGLFELLKKHLDPREILDRVLQVAKDALEESILANVAKRLLLMFNPVGAILAAIEAVYRVLKWVFENAARIFKLVETVVDGMAAIVAGNVGAMARAVEG